MRDDVAGMLGLAMRAGSLRCGFSAVREAVLRGHVHLIILAGDAGRSTTKRVSTLAVEHRCTLVTMNDTHYLGTALGRDAQAVVAVADNRFARTILAAWQQRLTAQGDGTKGDKSGGRKAQSISGCQRTGSKQ